MKGFKHTIALCAILLLVSLSSSQAQINNIDQLSPAQLKKFAKTAIRSNDAFTAIVFLERYHNLKPNDQEVNYQLAGLHRNVRNYLQAQELYAVVSKEALGKYPLSQFYYAQMLKATGNYEEAIAEFKKFKRDYQGKDEVGLQQNCEKRDFRLRQC